MSPITPSQVKLEDLSFPKLDLENAAIAFAADSSQKITTTPIKNNKRALCLSLKGELISEGIHVAEFSGRAAHSLGFKFAEDTDQEAFNSICMKIKDQVDESWNVASPMKNDVLYLKLKFQKDTAYSFMCNTKLVPKHAAAAGLFKYQEVEAQVDVQVYFNLEEKTCGAYLTLRNLVVKSDTPTKKVKKE
jgi:hypothetical protein